jgi:hypothetical protein
MYWKMGLSFDLPDHRSRDFWPPVVAALNPHGNAGRNVQLNLKVRQPLKRYNQVAER